MALQINENSKSILTELERDVNATFRTVSHPSVRRVQIFLNHQRQLLYLINLLILNLLLYELWIVILPELSILTFTIGIFFHTDINYSIRSYMRHFLSLLNHSSP